MAQLNTTRIEEIRKLGRKTLTDRDLDALIILALDRLAQASARAQRDQETETLRTSLAEERARLEKITRLYSETQQTIAINKRDLTTQDNYVLSLGRRLREAVGREHAIHEFQSHFVEQVHNCIDRRPLSAACAEHPALLRLQEALPERSIIPAKT